MDLGGALGACGGGDDEVEVAAGLAEAVDEGVLADAAGAADDDDEGVRVGSERVGGEGGPEGCLEGSEEFGAVGFVDGGDSGVAHSEARG